MLGPDFLLGLVASRSGRASTATAALGQICIIFGGFAFEIGPVLARRLVAAQLLFVLFVGRVLGRVFLFALILKNRKISQKINAE
jgi:hypothetical protein